MASFAVSEFASLALPEISCEASCEVVHLLFNIPVTELLMTAEQPFQFLISQLCFLNLEVPFILTPGIFQAMLLFGGNSINMY